MIALGAAGMTAWPQLKPQDLAQRDQWERFLATAEIIKAEPIGEGVTNPWRLLLKSGDIEHAAAWKNPDTKPPVELDKWRFEIAAYRLDKLIGLDMVPPAVEREFAKPSKLNAVPEKGALSFWADSKASLLNLVEAGQTPSASAEREKYITRLWDCLIANEDRTQQNILYDYDDIKGRWRTILIDHSRAFRSTKKYTDRLIFGVNGIQRSDSRQPILIRQVPRALYEKIMALTFDDIKQAVGPYLADGDIRAILARKELIKKEIEAMIKQNGEDRVLIKAPGNGQ